MKDYISVLITDDNIEFGSLLKEYISRESDIDIVGIARDGLQAIEMIKSLSPDIVVLDIIMPNLDGIGVLERLSEMQLEKKPLFIMLSAIGQDVFIQKAIELGAEYYIVKPFDIDVLITRIRQIYREKRGNLFSYSRDLPKTTQPTAKSKSQPQYTENGLEVEVTGLMRDIGIPPHVVGYRYLREAIIQTLNSEDTFNSVTKVLYPSVARKFNVTPQKVERAIRNAIESAWARGNPDSMDALLGYTINYKKGKPTNSEFIAMISDRIRVSKKLR